MKKVLSIAIVLSALLSSNAYAWFFFFLPGAVTGKIADAFTGAEGENCVGSTSKVGDNIRLPNGEIKVITSLSGTSTRCTNPEMPIRALLGNATTSTPNHVSKSGIDLSDSWVQRPLTDAMKSNGSLLMAANRTSDTGLLLSAVSHQGIPDMMAYAVSRRSRQASAMTDVQQSEITQSTMNGIPIWRFTVAGKLKDGTLFTYLMTLLESDREIVILNTWTPTANFVAQRETMEALATRISGLAGSTSAAIVTPAPAAPPASQPVAVATPPATPPTSAAMPTTPTFGSPASAASPATTPAGSVSGDAQRLRELNALYKDGVITQTEFEAKKKEILKSM